MTEGAPGRKLVHGLYWMEKTAMGRYPTSLIEFQAAFGTEAACAAYLVALRVCEFLPVAVSTEI
jgi:hypothetical protein